MDFSFTPRAPILWEGRYRRPKGEESAYHVKASGDITVRWRDKALGYKYNCPVLETEVVRSLAEAVNYTKRLKSGWAGGSFVINEFGQVVSPIAASSDRFLVGEASGPLCFEDPWDSTRVLSLIIEDIELGDEWKLPYIGIQYQLHAGDRIYFWHEDSEGGYKLEPSVQDMNLIERIRDIRPYGAVRFIVNQHGIVLTKKPYQRNRWRPVYVGKINYKKWFEKERG